MKNFFITGTDTSVGKTLSAAVLLTAMRGGYWKPIQSGMADEISDRDSVQKLTKLSDAHFFPSNYLLNANLSPDQAAARENIIIDLAQCTLPKTNASLIIEGAGGVYVPLNTEASMLDLMQKFNIPIVIVSRGTLGTINHTLLTIAALRQRDLTIHGIIFNGKLNPDNQAAIEKWGNVRTLLHIPEFNNITSDKLQAWVSQHQEKIEENFL